MEEHRNILEALAFDNGAETPIGETKIYKRDDIYAIQTKDAYYRVIIVPYDEHRDDDVDISEISKEEFHTLNPELLGEYPKAYIRKNVDSESLQSWCTQLFTKEKIILSFGMDDSTDEYYPRGYITWEGEEKKDIETEFHYTFEDSKIKPVRKHVFLVTGEPRMGKTHSTQLHANAPLIDTDSIDTQEVFQTKINELANKLNSQIHLSMFVIVGLHRNSIVHTNKGTLSFKDFLRTFFKVNEVTHYEIVFEEIRDFNDHPFDFSEEYAVIVENQSGLADKDLEVHFREIADRPELGKICLNNEPPVDKPYIKTTLISV